MRVKNKETGETYERTMPILFNIKTSGGGEHTVSCKSITELNEKWEDYEEPKEYWYIDCYGMVLRALYNGNEWDERRKLIGNYFETEEEAEKAVEKLKAWKRLKDKGFKFCGIDDDCIRFSIDISKVNSTEEEEELNKYGDLLFGGEE